MDPLNLAMMDLNKVEPRIFRMIDGGEIDPWDVDIVKLCEMYMGEIKSRKDLRISGNALLTAAVLLRFKSGIFDDVPPATEDLRPELPLPDIEIIPISRTVERKVTVFELLDALKDAFDVEQQRILVNKSRPEIKFYAFDMSGAIERILGELPDFVLIDSLGAITLLVILHLADRGVVDIEQSEWNGAIGVRKLGGSGLVYGRQAGEEARAG